MAGRLRAAIADGRLPLGGRPPASRVLADELGVSRGVVTEAYQRLAEEGQVAGRGRAGTVVVATPATPPAAPTRAAVPPPEALFGAAVGTEIFEALRAAPARIDLTPGGYAANTASEIDEGVATIGAVLCGRQGSA
ncbi:GntR family transcriptional regulator [Micromonospora sp. IBSANI012]|uniref:GntR family transcriptional regulator n=1 Tax=Micromonospora sp. IBSANI012 TaxID=3457761 RepID=UPI004059893E